MENAEEVAANAELKTSILKFYDLIGMVCPNKRLPVLNMLGCPLLAPPTPLGMTFLYYNDVFLKECCDWGKCSEITLLMMINDDEIMFFV